jgi:predicted CXXCH cytochrome family protein
MGSFLYLSWSGDGEDRVKHALTVISAMIFAALLGSAMPSWAADDSAVGSDKTTGQTAALTKAECYSCHSAAAVAAKAPPGVDAARLRELQIDPAAFDQSVHADLSCDDCHGDGVTHFPHQGAFQGPVKSCPECHKRQNRTIVPEFMQSVHARLGPNAFTCYSCHDPHNVRKAASLGGVRNLAHRDNGMCLGCHNSDVQYAKWSKDKRPDLLVVHSWQPNPQIHWTAVRCIDCHTPEKPNGAIAHDILPKAQAERHCVDCHSTNSSLLTRLYRHEVEEERTNAAGFINAYVLTHAYVVGVTRNAYLDWGSLVLFLVLVAGLAGHGLLRYVGFLIRREKK